MLDLNVGKFNGNVPAADFESDLDKILDSTALQTILEDFYSLTGMSMTLMDTTGRILVNTGWQDICTFFHRKHPESQQNCLDSDIYLSGGVKAGEFKLYKCKNGMWDIVTPVFVQGSHLANLYFGQFFFTDEKVDLDYFIAQAERYGYNLADYETALKNVPRYSREEVAKVMSFYMHLALHISQLSYNNMILAHNLKMNEEISETQKLLAMMLDQSRDRILVSDLEGNIIYSNLTMAESSDDSIDEIRQKNILAMQESQPVDLSLSDIFESTKTDGFWRGEVMNRLKDGSEIYSDLRTRRIDDEQGNPVALCGISTDITERRLYQDMLRYQNAASQKLIEISRKLLNSRSYNFEQSIGECLQDLGELLKLDRVYIVIINEAMTQLSNTHEWCKDGLAAQKNLFQERPLRQKTGMLQEILAKRMICVEEISSMNEAWWEERNLLQSLGVEALLAAPIVHEDKSMGFLGFDMVGQARIWDEIDFMVIQITADLLSATFERLNFEESLLVQSSST